MYFIHKKQYNILKFIDVIVINIEELLLIMPKIITVFYISQYV